MCSCEFGKKHTCGLEAPMAYPVELTGSIYLRDLKDSVREEYEREIRKKRPDLIPVLEAGEEDIQVGESFKASCYEVV